MFFLSVTATSRAHIRTTELTSQEEQNLIDLINAYRFENGVLPLTFDQNSYDAAFFHSTDMATNNFFGHNGSDGRTYQQRLEDFNVGSPYHELLYLSGLSANQVFNGFVANSFIVQFMLADFNAIGVSEVNSKWTVVLSHSSSVPDGPVMTTSQPSINFGTATINSSTTSALVISNIGNAALNYALSISGPNAADFSISSEYSGTVTPGAFELIQITFTPSLTGARAASLMVNGNDPFNPSDQIVLSGTGLLSQTITFDEIPGMTYGDAPFQLIATASSGLPVTFSSLDPTIASVNGNVVTIHKAGTVVIRASQFGNPTYIGAMVERELIIDKVVLTVTADDKTISYGDAIPVFTISYTGFIEGDDAQILTSRQLLTSYTHLWKSTTKGSKIPVCTCGC